MARAFTIEAAGVRLEAAWHGPGPDQAATLVLLHEGLGCVSTWRDFPAELAADTGLGVLVYSRVGYGASDPVRLPRPLTYMHDEGLRILPAVLEAAGVRTALPVGHSDGASIALIWAGGTTGGPRRAGLALLAPHVFCEDRSVAGIEAARADYNHGDLRARLARHHGDNVDCAFWGWNGAWLDPGFRGWNLEELLPAIRVPVLVMQGDADPYGTLAQVDAIARAVRAPVERLIVPGGGHAPHRERPVQTRAAIASFARTMSPSASA